MNQLMVAFDGEAAEPKTWLDHELWRLVVLMGAVGFLEVLVFSQLFPLV